MKLSQEILAARENRELTVAQLGDSIGVSSEMVECFEKGEIVPNDHLLKKISIALDLDFVKLVEGKKFSLKTLSQGELFIDSEGCLRNHKKIIDKSMIDSNKFKIAQILFVLVTIPLIVLSLIFVFCSLTNLSSGLVPLYLSSTLLTVALYTAGIFSYCQFDKKPIFGGYFMIGLAFLSLFEIVVSIMGKAVPIDSPVVLAFGVLSALFIFGAFKNRLAQIILSICIIVISVISFITLISTVLVSSGFETFSLIANILSGLASIALSVSFLWCAFAIKPRPLGL